ncbi:MAG: phytanoyl-CoA dioxygenase family protein [Caldilineaceae bacterium]|nr:phytanoyl-CoA dioxygenase family protein [Caldilineaceae bacterium]
MLNEQQLDHFDTFGFVVLRRVFGADELATIEAEYEDGLNAAYAHLPFDGSKRHWTNTLGPDTPYMASMLEDARFLETAQQLFGADVIGMGADANRYVGHTRWHPDHYTDPTKDTYGIKFAYYLDPVGAKSGALRVVPGSHREPYHSNVGATIRGAGLDIPDVPSYVCESLPGDVVAFDLRLWHASWGGSDGRRMCTFVYYNNPKGKAEEDAARNRAANSIRATAQYDRPDDPLYPLQWLENRGGSELRQQWIDRLGELGFLDSPAEAAD